MDHEVVPRPYKIYVWLLNLSRDHLCLHQGENVKVTMGFKDPKSRILKPILFIDIVQRILWWERQKGCSSKKKASGREILL